MSSWNDPYAERSLGERIWSYVRSLLIILIAIGIILGVAWGMVLHVRYDMDRYHRKYPGTTTMDYWTDGKR